MLEIIIIAAIVAIIIFLGIRSFWRSCNGKDMPGCAGCAGCGKDSCNPAAPESATGNDRRDR